MIEQRRKIKRQVRHDLGLDSDEAETTMRPAEEIMRHMHVESESEIVEEFVAMSEDFERLAKRYRRVAELLKT